MAVLMGKSGSCRRTRCCGYGPQRVLFGGWVCLCRAGGGWWFIHRPGPGTSRERPKNAPVLPGCIRAGINQTVPMIGEGTVDLVKTGSARSRSRAATRTDRAVTRRGSFLIA